MQWGNKIIRSLIRIEVLILVVVVIFIFVKIGKVPLPFLTSLNQPSPTQLQQPTIAPEQQLMKIGEETIYTNDLAIEKKYYPTEPGVDVDKILQDKLITDSIILQAGAKEGYITLDPTIYNSPGKEYLKRIASVKEVIEKVGSNSASLSGALVSIWFMNNNPGPIGYEKGKEIAYATIKPLYDKVKSGAITIKEAGDQIANTKALAQVDKAYEVNAYYEFRKPLGEEIFFDEQFDKVLRSLKPGEITELTTLQDFENGGGEVRKEAVYTFAQLYERKESQIVSFDSWLVEKRKQYEVIDL